MRRSYGRTLGEVGQDKPVTAWMTDMDGVLVHEGRLVPGADAFIGRLRDSGTPFLVLTNNSIYTPRDLRYRLLRSGVKVPVDDLDAVRLISGGARFVATNPDPTGPSTEGVLPATGSVAASISRATGVEPYFVGKPNPLMMRAALNRLQPHSETTVMIGDRMDTDVVAGLEAGMRTVLVLTGITGEGDVERFPYRPSRVVDSIADLLTEL